MTSDRPWDVLSAKHSKSDEITELTARIAELEMSERRCKNCQHGEPVKGNIRCLVPLPQWVLATLYGRLVKISLRPRDDGRECLCYTPQNDDA